jgi:WD40 repeat protein
MDDRLKPLDLLEPPDQWDEIQRRIPTLERQAPPPLGRRVAAIAVASILAAGITFAVVRALPDEDRTTPGGSSGPVPSPTTSPPAATPTPTPSAGATGPTAPVATVDTLPGSGTLVVASGDSLSAIAAGSSAPVSLAVPSDFDGCCGIAISPDGSSVAYGVGGEGNGTIEVVNVRDGSVVASAPTGGTAQFPAWSPDGTAVVFDDGKALQIFSVHGRAISPVSSPPGPCADEYPALESSSGALAFFRDCVGGNDGGVYMQATIGSAPTRLLGVAGSEIFRAHGALIGLTWSPDGTQLAAQMADASVWTISVRDGRLVNGLVPSAGPDAVNGFGTIAWSPDGQEIAFIRDGEVQLVDLTGRVVALGPTEGSNPSSISWTAASS